MILEGQPRTVTPVVQDEIYRIAREVLRNAFRHAAARRIEAAIQYDPDLFRLRIRRRRLQIRERAFQATATPGVIRLRVARCRLLSTQAGAWVKPRLDGFSARLASIPSKFAPFL